MVAKSKAEETALHILARSLVGLPVLIALLVVASGIQALPALGGSPGGVTTRVSVGNDGAESNGPSVSPALSGDGRYLVFQSFADNLVAADSEGFTDIFRRDTVAGATIRVSENAGGEGANADSTSPDISADGLGVVFLSSAGNLLSSVDPIQAFAAFFTGADPIELVNVSDGGASCPKIAGVSFGQPSPFGSLFHVVLYYDSAAGTVRVRSFIGGTDEQLTGVKDIEGCPQLSEDGRYVTYGRGGKVFRWDSETDVINEVAGGGATSQGSRDGRAIVGFGPSDASTNPDISGDGRYITFESHATNLVPGDTNGWRDIFVHDTETLETTRISVASDGTEADAWSHNPSISDDGRFVAFGSQATDLVPGDTNGKNDVFLHDRETGETIRVSVNTDGSEGDDHSSFPDISGDGRSVVFSGAASTLVAGDTNGLSDVFVHKLPALVTPGEDRVWGDNNCSGSADPIDSLLTLRSDAGLDTNTGECPALGQVVDVAFASPHPWGDVDCGGEVTPVDSLKLLRFDAGLGVTQPTGCPEIGSVVTVTLS